MYEAPPWLLALGVLLTSIAAAGALYAWPSSRERRRIVIAAVATGAAFLVWRAALIIANGVNLDIDYSLLLGLSFEDLGTAVMVFLFAAVALGLGTDQAQPAKRVVTSAGLASVAAMLVDRFIV